MRVMPVHIREVDQHGPIWQVPAVTLPLPTGQPIAQVITVT
jgi:hypothetical protein